MATMDVLIPKADGFPIGKEQIIVSRTMMDAAMAPEIAAGTQQGETSFAQRAPSTRDRSPG